MVKSLAWRIQIWQGLTMFAVVAALGVFMYLRIERAEMERIDTELESAAQVIVGTLASLSEEEFQRGDFIAPPLGSDRLMLPPADRGPPPRDRPPPPRHRRRPRREDDLLTFIIWNLSLIHI